MGVGAEGSAGRLSCPTARSPTCRPRIREHLLLHAQEIFLEAFNHVWEEYASPAKRYAGSSLEETAMRVAWAAVKRSYVKIGDRWLRRR
jgi:cation transport regulator